MRLTNRSLTVASLLLLSASAAHAQAPGIDVRLNPRIGLYVPLTDLRDAQQAATDIANEMEGSLAIGLGLEIDLPILPFNVRANLDYATGSKVTVEGSTPGTTEDVETTLLAVVGDVVFRPFPRIIVLQPYVFAGGGLKQYDFDEEQASGTTFADEGDLAIHLGGGLDLGLGPLALNLELGDYLSWFEVQDEDPEMQHDLFVTVGFSIGIL